MVCNECAEVFSGRSAIWHGYQAKNMRASRFDTRVDESHNCHTKAGVLCLARMLVAVNPESGVAMFEPTCSSWIWLCRATTLRSVVSCCHLVHISVVTGVPQE